ncbi:MAG TPA: intradiol ring-cleavage dioxygenase [Thermoanaerobaculia bacterium]|nr:intradiol ring-cleavage dioxygenase [Thermoanaerobaculia bacterium]
MGYNCWRMQNDDYTTGQVLTRREALALLAVAGCSLLVGRSPASAQPVCVVRPEQTEGPFFVDERLKRSDLRTDPATRKVTPGVPLDLTLAVSRLTGGGCAPLAGVLVDVWHCDHLGIYSDAEDKLLRGYQVTDARGRARFKTIYPGWYQGRTVHIHFKLRSAPTVRPGFDFTSQLYFDDALTDRVYTQAPYAARGARRIRNNRDGIYRHGGSQLLLSLAPSGAGYAGTFDVALQGT